MLTFVNVSASYNSNLYLPQQQAAILANPADVHNRIIGSILVIPLEQLMLLSTWGVKTCIWIYLYRNREDIVWSCLILLEWIIKMRKCGRTAVLLFLHFFGLRVNLGWAAGSCKSRNEICSNWDRSRHSRHSKEWMIKRISTGSFLWSYFWCLLFQVPFPFGIKSRTEIGMWLLHLRKAGGLKVPL